MKKLNVIKIIDVYGWAFHFIGKDMQKHSQHNVIINKYNNIGYGGADIIISSCPTIGNITRYEVPKICQQRGIKFIGQYCSENQLTYSHADLIITISPQVYKWAKNNCSYPVIYLPESVDVNFFAPKERNSSDFIVGWAGNGTRPLKRTHLLNDLNVPVYLKSEHGIEFFKENRTLDSMLDFYHSINCYVLVSSSECQPRVVMEAMACGLPVISTNVGSIPLLLDKDWIIPVNPEAEVVKQLKEKITLLKKNPSLKKEVGERNRKFIEEKFSWEKNQIYWDRVFEALKNNDFKTITNINNEVIDGLTPKFKEMINE